LAVARRLVRRAMEMAKGDLRGIDFGHIRSVMDLARSTEGHGRLQAPGLDIFRSFEWLRFGQPGVGGLEYPQLPSDAGRAGNRAGARHQSRDFFGTD
jgi:hypothetical protein